MAKGEAILLDSLGNDTNKAVSLPHESERSVSLSPSAKGTETVIAASTASLVNQRQDSGKETQSTTIDWESPKDPDNPRNWPPTKKVLHTSIPAIYGFALTVGTSTFVAAIPFVQQKFDVSRTVALLAITLYTAGFALGPLIAAPISEIWGRRPIYWSNLPLLCIFNAAAAASDNLAALLVCRFLAGLGGSGVLAVGAGTIADVWDPKQAGPVAVSYILAPFLGPSLGPLIGAYIVEEYGNWKWAIWIILIICAPVALAMVFMEETSKTQILKTRAKRRRTFEPGQYGTHESLGKRISDAMLRPLYMLVLEPLTLLISIYTAFNFAMLFSFFGSFSYIFSTQYGFNSREIGLCYIGIIVGFIFALATFGFFDAAVYRKKVAQTVDGDIAPEHRLYAALLGSFLLPVGLFWLAWSPRPSVHWIVPVLAGLPFGWGSLAVFLAACTYLVDVYGVANGASAIAANGVLRFLLGAVFPLFTIQMYTNLGIGWAGSVFAFISVLLLPVPWIFFWKGKALRERSFYANTGTRL